MRIHRIQSFTVMIGMCLMFVFGLSDIDAQIIPGRIIRVPEEYSTIQEAINVASNGDMVSVNSGTYSENITFNGRLIKVYSRSGPDQTVIRGDNTTSVVTFENSETAAAKLIGFTITNGTGTGGGVRCTNGASPTIKENVITGNQAYFGGGVACVGTGSNPTIEQNIISSNGSTGGQSTGGGIYCFGSNPTIIDNTIIDNTATFGGGIAVEGSDNFYIVGNKIGIDGGGYHHANTAECGAGIYLDNASGTLGAANHICSNRAELGTALVGGGICLIDCQNITIDDENQITLNYAPNGGGGIFAYVVGTLIIKGSTILTNTTSSNEGVFQAFPGGSGIYAEGCGLLEISHCTIMSNKDQYWGYGGGICCVENSNVSIKGNRIEYNQTYRDGAGIFYNNDDDLTVQDIVNNLIAKNVIHSWPQGPYAWGGAGIYIDRGTPILTNNTVTLNDFLTDNGVSKGGGIYSTLESNPVVTNTIVWGNGLALNVSPPEAREIFIESGGSMPVNYCDVWMPQGLWPGNQNQNEAPQFIDLSYRINGTDTPISICIDNGHNDAPSWPAVDFELDPRPTDGDGDLEPVHDIGWDEYIPG